MLRITLYTIGVMFLFSGCGSNTVGPVQEPPVNMQNVVLKNEYQEMLDAINQARSVKRDCQDGEGVVGPSRPLYWNNILYASAYEHSYDLAHSNTFSHYGSGTEYDIAAMNQGSDRSTFYDRILSQGYGEFFALGENIAAGQTTLAQVVEAWINSPGHCANLMNSDFTEVGMAVVVEPDSDYGIYWTQNFGSKP